MILKSRYFTILTLFFITILLLINLNLSDFAFYNESF